MTPSEPPYDPDYDLPETTGHKNGYAFARTPPQDVAAERMVLGAAMVEAAVIDKCAGVVTASDFYRPAHETIWRTLTALHAGDAPTDPTAVVGHLRETGELRLVGDAPYIIDLYTSAPMAAGDAIYHARTVDQLARQRAAIAVHERALQRLYAPGADVDETLYATTTELIEARDTLANPPANSTWASLDLADVLAGGELDPPPALLARDDGQLLLYAGGVHTLAGEPGSGKTWITLIAAAQEIATGHNVTMIDFEDRASRVVGRLLAIGAHPDAVRHHFRYVRPNVGLDDTSRHALGEAICGASLVILDGVTEAMTMHGLDLNGNADVATFYGLLPRWIADHGPAVVMIDHVVKDGEKQGRWALGGQHKLAGIDGVSYLVKAVEPFGRGKVGNARITIGKDRPGYVEEIALGRTVAEIWLDARDEKCLRYELKPPTAIPTDDAGQMRPTHLMERVSRWLEINPNAGTDDVVDAVHGKATYVRKALTCLVSEGFVEVEQLPRNKRAHRSVSPFRNEPDREES